MFSTGTPAAVWIPLWVVKFSIGMKKLRFSSTSQIFNLYFRTQSTFKPKSFLLLALNVYSESVLASV